MPARGDEKGKWYSLKSHKKLNHVAGGVSAILSVSIMFKLSDAVSGGIDHLANPAARISVRRKTPN
jgi:hypothetical protein